MTTDDDGEGDVREETTKRAGEPKAGGNRHILGALHRRLHAHPALALTTKIVVTIIGALAIAAGMVMTVTPGPGLVMVVVGLAILATEWAWAERWLRKAKQKAEEAKGKAEAMDPRVRRRRILVGTLVVLVLGGVVLSYVAAYGWPRFALDGWDWVQGIAGWLPELPGAATGPPPAG